ncbi:MAG TPA: hypothetical protein VN512_06335 [Clostridia bacterium]|nr:hypothetical protein [Clostridia bacterium]
MPERIKNIGRRPRMLLSAVMLAALCVAALTACSNGAAFNAVTPVAEASLPISSFTPSTTASAAAASPTISLAADAETAIDPRYIFTDWTSQCGAWLNGGKPNVFYGVMVNGNREGNTLSVSLAQEREKYCRNRIVLTTASGAWEAEFPSVLDAELNPIYRDATIQCSDLDGDTTDEIILTYYYGSTGGEADVHVFRVADGSLTEIMARYDNTWVEKQAWMAEAGAQPLSVYGRCAGVNVYLTDGYELALRVIETAFATDPTDNQRYATVFSEYSLTENGWEPIRENVMVTDADQRAAVRERLRGVLLIDADANVYGPLGSMGADLTGSGNVMDRVYLSDVSTNDNSCIVVETQLYRGERKLDALYRHPGSSAYNYVLNDLDGDGAEEFFVVFSYSDESAPDIVRCLEMHLLKYTENAFKDVLTVAANAPFAARTYENTLFIPENTVGLDIPANDFANSVGWAEVVWLDGRYMLRLEHVKGSAYSSPVAGYSYLVFEDGAWTLYKQSETALDR